MHLTLEYAGQVIGVVALAIAAGWGVAELLRPRKQPAGRRR